MAIYFKRMNLCLKDYPIKADTTFPYRDQKPPKNARMTASGARDEQKVTEQDFQYVEHERNMGKALEGPKDYSGTGAIEVRTTHGFAQMHIPYQDGTKSSARWEDQ